MIRYVNALAKELKHDTGKTLIGVRVLDNCLLCYFHNNSCRFVSKSGFNWGPIGSFYIPTKTYAPSKMTTRIKEQFPDVIQWVDDYVNSNFIGRIIKLSMSNFNYG